MRERIFYGIPDVLGEHTTRYAGQSVMVVGGGHSAINAHLDLAELKTKYPKAKIVWTLRKSQVSEAYGGEDKDGLPARSELGIRIRILIESEQITVLTPFHIREIGQEDGTLTVCGTMNSEDVMEAEIDEIITDTGVRPDLSFLSEIRLSLDPALESVYELAPLIDPNVHSCGTVRPHGEKELRQSEKDFYIDGVKSYGRAPTVLISDRL